MQADSTPAAAEHRFDEQLACEAATATGDRLPYEVLMKQRELLLKQPFAATADGAKNPIIFFSQTRQMVHANAAALRMIILHRIEDSVGLRQGELFGCEHKMSSRPGEVYVCQDCNNMSSLRSALEGRPSREPRTLIMHDRPDAPRAAFNISAVPVSVGQMTFAMVIYEVVDGTMIA